MLTRVGRYEVEERPSQELLRPARSQESLGRIIDADDLSLVENHQRIGVKLHEPAITFLALAQGVLVAPALGGISRHLRESTQPAVVVTQGANVDVRPE